MYFVQRWFALADEALEDAIYDSQALRNFVGIDLVIESVPDATTSPSASLVVQLAISPEFMSDWAV